MWNKPELPFSHPDWMSRHFSSNSLADQLYNPSGLWINCECFFQAKQNSLFSSSLVKIRAVLTTGTVLLITEWHLGDTLLPLNGGMWGSHHAHTHRTTYTLSATSRSKHLCSTKYVHVVQVCVWQCSPWVWIWSYARFTHKVWAKSNGKVDIWSGICSARSYWFKCRQCSGNYSKQTAENFSLFQVGDDSHTKVLFHP